MRPSPLDAAPVREFPPPVADGCPPVPSAPGRVDFRDMPRSDAFTDFLARHEWATTLVAMAGS